MARVNFNIKGFLGSAKQSQVLKNNLRLVAQDILQEKKEELLSEFDNHVVTKEIEGGIGASNASKTLRGADGNLFSFIGFESGSNPTEEVREIIKNDIKVGRGINLKQKGNGLEFITPLIIPSESEIESRTPLPFEETKSWLFGIEDGISGLGSFIAKIGKGRSLGGVQSPREIRTSDFKPVSYFRSMLNKFKRKLKG